MGLTGFGVAVSAAAWGCRITTFPPSCLSFLIASKPKLSVWGLGMLRVSGLDRQVAMLLLEAARCLVSFEMVPAASWTLWRHLLSQRNVQNVKPT